jgi:hypothetical protein
MYRATSEPACLAFGAEQLERLSHRPAAHVQLARNAGLDQPLAPDQATREDLVADAIGRILGQRSGRLDRLQVDRYA